MSLLNCTMKRLSVGTSTSPSRGSANTTTGGTFGFGGGGEGGATSAVTVGGVVMFTVMALMYVTPSRVSGLPITSIHRPVSRLRLASSSQPDPLGFLPLTQTANSSSLITQSEDVRWLCDGRSP